MEGSPRFEVVRPADSERPGVVSGFDRHGIDHSSMSQVNTFAASPSKWIAEKLFRRKFPASPAMWRGIAAETAVRHVLQNGWEVERAIKAGYEQYDHAMALELSSARERERDMIEPIVHLALEELAPLGTPDLPESGQRKVSITARGDDWSLEVIGFVDLPYDKDGLVVDLKTTGRMPAGMSQPHRRQCAFYARTTNYRSRFLYVTPKKAAWLEVPADEIAPMMNETKRLLERQERFLRLGTREELAAICPVNPEDWYWKDAEGTRRELFGV